MPPKIGDRRIIITIKEETPSPHDEDASVITQDMPVTEPITPVPAPENNPTGPFRLLDLPPEPLCLILDFAASRDDDEKPRHPLFVVRGKKLVRYQPALSMVCKQLRAALLPHFYSAFGFQMKWGSYWTKSSGWVWDALHKFSDQKVHDLETLNLKIVLRPADWTPHLIQLLTLWFQHYQKLKSRMSAHMIRRTISWSFEVHGKTTYDFKKLTVAIYGIALRVAVARENPRRSFSQDLHQNFPKKNEDEDEESPALEILLSDFTEDMNAPTIDKFREIVSNVYDYDPGGDTEEETQTESEYDTEDEKNDEEAEEE